ncbi:hypothetical protein EW146_g6672 [Bondarzewia mesenterica]|uniref:Hydrophobin n=1 Tax=Bondarzewia mesenterica TaxID=1095465 RepID=A0A4S4LPW1_9AGAM|nr:hypothetical protein EW146_g6672 [Bondarzewia mesenterica]
MARAARIEGPELSSTDGSGKDQPQSARRAPNIIAELDFSSSSSVSLGCCPAYIGPSATFSAFALSVARARALTAGTQWCVGRASDSLATTHLGVEETVLLFVVSQQFLVTGPRHKLEDAQLAPRKERSPFSANTFFVFFDVDVDSPFICFVSTARVFGMFAGVPLFTLSVLGFALVASATPLAWHHDGKKHEKVEKIEKIEEKDAGQCNSGPVQCCNSLTQTSDPSIANILGGLNIPIQGIDIPVGLTCNPINVIGIGGTNCASQPVCCENNSFSGVVALGCTPINVGL